MIAKMDQKLVDIVLPSVHLAFSALPYRLDCARI
jgi:hypothetical protein